MPDQTTPAPVIAKPFRPNHFYDEQRLLLGRTYRAGDKIRLTVPAGAATTTVDLLDSQQVAAPKVDLVAAERARLRRRPDRPPRLGGRRRPGDRLRQGAPT